MIRPVSFYTYNPKFTSSRPSKESEIVNVKMTRKDYEEFQDSKKLSTKLTNGLLATFFIVTPVAMLNNQNALYDEIDNLTIELIDTQDENEDLKKEAKRKDKEIFELKNIIEQYKNNNIDKNNIK